MKPSDQGSINPGNAQGIVPATAETEVLTAANTEAHPISWLILRLWHRLTEPAAAVTDFETRLKSRWMAILFVVLIPFGLVVASIPRLVDGRPPWEDPKLPGILALFVFLGICYALTRHGHYKLAALLAVGAATLTIFGISFLDHDVINQVNNTTYLIATLIFSSILLSQRSTLVLLVLDVIGLLMMPVLSPEVDLEAILKRPLSLLVMTFALVAFGAYLRNALESHHVSTLRRENVERQQAEERVRAALQEKEVLLKEIHHRVKNNLQIISSLLSLQSSSIDDPLTLAKFQDSQNRVRSMALIHERLYRSDDLARIEFGAYLRDLAASLVQTYRGQAQSIRLQVEAEPILLDIDTAIPCGLLVNELVSNALKHAFPNGRGGVLGVEMRSLDESHYQLAVWDDGIGFPADVDFQRTPSLGLQLVNSLTRQLGGTVALHTPPGTKITICFAKTIPPSVVPMETHQ